MLVALLTAFVAGLGALLTLFGAVVFATLDRRAPSNVPRLVGAGYFLGVATLLFLWRAFALIAHRASVSLDLALIVMALVTAVLARRSGALGPLDRAARDGRLAVLATTYPLVALFNFLYWNWPIHHPSMGSIFSKPGGSSLGTAAASRYANIATFIHLNDRIPIVAQSYGQSLLGSLPSFVRLDRPYLSLVLWLGLSVTMLVVLSLGILIELGASRWWLGVGALVVFAGSPRLGFVATVLTDTHATPILSNGYSDSVVVMGTSWLALEVLALATLGGEARRRWPFVAGAFAVLAVLACSWAMTGAYTLYLYGATSAVLLAYMLWTERREWRAAIGWSAALLVIAAVAFAFARRSGGMFASTRLVETLDLPGIFTAPPAKPMYKIGYSYIVVEPSTYRIVDMDYWRFELTGGHLLDRLDVATQHKIESLLWDFVRSAFYPLLGLATLAQVGFVARRASLPLSLPPERRRALAVMIVLLSGTLVAGGGIDLFVQFGDDYSKWIMTRFLMAAYWAGTIVLVISLHEARRVLGLGRGWIALVVFLTVIGPVVAAGFTIKAQSVPEEMPYQWRMLTTLHGYTVQQEPPP